MLCSTLDFARLIAVGNCRAVCKRFALKYTGIPQRSFRRSFSFGEGTCQTLATLVDDEAPLIEGETVLPCLLQQHLRFRRLCFACSQLFFLLHVFCRVRAFLWSGGLVARRMQMLSCVASTASVSTFAFARAHNVAGLLNDIAFLVIVCQGCLLIVFSIA